MRFIIITKNEGNKNCRMRKGCWCFSVGKCIFSQTRSADAPIRSLRRLRKRNDLSKPLGIIRNIDESKTRNYNEFLQTEFLRIGIKIEIVEVQSYSCKVIHSMSALLFVNAFTKENVLSLSYHVNVHLGQEYRAAQILGWASWSVIRLPPKTS